MFRFETSSAQSGLEHDEPAHTTIILQYGYLRNVMVRRNMDGFRVADRDRGSRVTDHRTQDGPEKLDA